MPKARREKICYLCEKADLLRTTFMVCSSCHRHFCSRHGDPKLEECITCLDSGEEL